MNRKIGRNDPCICGSNNKYKKCCLVGIKLKKSLYETLMSGDLQFFSRIVAKEGAIGSMQVSKVEVSKQGVKQILLDDEITISTNKISGDATEESLAMIAIPVNKSTDGKILISGNANISNNQPHLKLEITNDRREISLRSTKGLFAIIRISKHRDGNFSFLSILFGETGIPERINNSGRKNRSDIAIYPNGNGKFIRLSDKDCNIDQSWIIENTLTYQSSNHKIYPSKVIISSTRYSEKLIINFSYDAIGEKVMLENSNFE